MVKFERAQQLQPNYTSSGVAQPCFILSGILLIGTLLWYGMLQSTNNSSVFPDTSSPSSNNVTAIGSSSSPDETTSSLTTSTTTTGRMKQRGEQAFVLAVELQFQSQEDATYIIEEWQTVTDYCYQEEPFLYHYELSQSDQDPLNYFMYERYRSKEDYLQVHKTSEAFLKFRQILKTLQDDEKVIVSGHSYNELGVGFV